MEKNKHNAYLVTCDGGPIHVLADTFNCYEGDLTFYNRVERPSENLRDFNNIMVTAIARGHWSRVELLNDDPIDLDAKEQEAAP